MNNTQLTIRTDTKTKETITRFAKSLGLSTGAFMLAAAKESINNESVTLTPQYDPEFVKMIREAEAEFERGEFDGPFKPAEALAHLDALMDEARNDRG